LINKPEKDEALPSK
jgi:hypothetical protein